MKTDEFGSRDHSLDIAAFNDIEFFTWLSDGIDKASEGDRISIATMSINPEEEPVAELLDKMAKASVRGAEVQLAADHYTYLYARKLGLLALPESIIGNQKVAARDKAFGDLQEDGVRVGIINPRRSLVTPVHRGRSHIKAFAINNEVRIGGPNLHDINRLDIVAGGEDSALANTIHSLIGSMVTKRYVKDIVEDSDKVIPVSSNSDLVLDAGNVGQSTILDRTIDMIEAADESVTFASQYFPTGHTLGTLKDAFERGCSVNIIYNHPDKHDGFNLFHDAVLFWTRRSGAPKSFFENMVPLDLPKSHMTAVATEKEAVVTGHNFIYAGVRAGTAELAFFSTEPNFTNSVRNVIQSRVA